MGLDGALADVRQQLAHFDAVGHAVRLAAGAGMDQQVQVAAEYPSNDC